MRRKVGVYLTLIGLALFVLGAEPELFDLDKSDVIGFVQVTVFSAGLLVICVGGSIALDSLWPEGGRSILADLGLRFAWTGTVVALSTGMADVFGLGTRPLIDTATFFGYWQSRGVLIGEIIILAGFLMMVPFRPIKPEEPEQDVPKLEITED